MIHLFLWPLLFAQALLGAESPSSFSAEVSINQSSITIYDTFTLKLKLKYPPTHKPDSFLLIQHLLRKDKIDDQPLSLVDQELLIPPTEEGQVVTQELSYALEPWQEGTLPVTFRFIRFQPLDPAKDKPVDIWADILSIDVKDTKEKKEDISFELMLLPPPGTPPIGIDPKLRQEMAKKQKQESEKNIQKFAEHSFPWETTLACVALLALFRWGGRLMRKIIEFSKRATGRLPPEEEALHKLLSLEKESLPQKGLIEKYYVLLTGIVRHYIEEKYRISAPEYTTEEFLKEAAASSSFTESSRSLLERFLNYADLVKFARKEATLNDCTDALDSAKRFIRP